MKKINWQVKLGAVLLLLSSIFYVTHYLIFKDAHHIFIYLLGDIAFIPIDVLIVTIIIHQLLIRREKAVMLKKLNMVIGAFYSEVGSRLLKSLKLFDEKKDYVGKELAVENTWSNKVFHETAKKIKKYEFSINSKKSDMQDLKIFLTSKRDFLLRLLENPNLLEHETFTELLWAVFHLTEELENRVDFKSLPQSDLNHLSGDIKRVYALLIYEWLFYMKHLKRDYPYLFSLAVRINPFSESASPIVV